VLHQTRATGAVLFMRALLRWVCCCCEGSREGALAPSVLSSGLESLNPYGLGQVVTGIVQILYRPGNPR
jgi:hypothetical protein